MDIFTIILGVIYIILLILSYYILIYKKTKTTDDVISDYLFAGELISSATLAPINDQFINVKYDDESEKMIEVIEDAPLNLDGTTYSPQEYGKITYTNNGFSISGIMGEFTCPETFIWNSELKICQLPNLCENENSEIYKGISYNQSKLIYNYRSARAEQIQYHKKLYVKCPGDELLICPDGYVYKNKERISITENPCTRYDICEQNLNGFRHIMPIDDETTLDDNQFYICENGESVLITCSDDLLYDQHSKSCQQSICEENDLQPNLDSNNSYFICKNGVYVEAFCDYGLAENKISCAEEFCKGYPKYTVANDLLIPYTEPLYSSIETCNEETKTINRRTPTSKTATFGDDIEYNLIYFIKNGDTFSEIDLTDFYNNNVVYKNDDTIYKLDGSIFQSVPLLNSTPEATVTEKIEDVFTTKKYKTMNYAATSRGMISWTDGTAYTPKFSYEDGILFVIATEQQVFNYYFSFKPIESSNTGEYLVTVFIDEESEDVNLAYKILSNPSDSLIPFASITTDMIELPDNYFTDDKEDQGEPDDSNDSDDDDETVEEKILRKANTISNIFIPVFMLVSKDSPIPDEITPPPDTVNAKSDDSLKSDETDNIIRFNDLSEKAKNYLLLFYEHFEIVTGYIPINSIEEADFVPFNINNYI